MPFVGPYGLGALGTDPYGSIADFIVTGATAITPYAIDVEFNDVVAYDAASANPANYQVSPPVTVTSVQRPSGTKARLIVSAPPLIHIPYEVTVVGITSTVGTPINPAHNTATFAGPSGPGGAFRAVGISETRIHLVFNAELLQNATLTDPASYTVTEVNGSPVSVSSVVVERGATSLVLVLSAPMRSTIYYQVALGPGVVDLAGDAISPPTSTFQWVKAASTGTFRVSDFTGEVSGGLLGNPLGLVFFSPALVTAVPNSTMQVDEVDVCSKAYDTYTLPQPLDPRPLYTFGGSVTPTPYATALNQDVLFAPFPRLVDAKFILEFTGSHNNDFVPAPIDGAVTATLQETWVKNRVALLNNTAWKLFDNTGATVPPVFITADNLTPIPPGPTTLLIVSMPLAAEATTGAGATVGYGATAAVSATATVSAAAS